MRVPAPEQGREANGQFIRRGPVLVFVVLAVVAGLWSLRSGDPRAARPTAGEGVLAFGDSLVEGDASGREWKTAPLIGLRFFTTYLHDGRAHSVEDAILAHDGEGRAAADHFRALSPSDRATLTSFVEAL